MRQVYLCLIVFCAAFTIGFAVYADCSARRSYASLEDTACHQPDLTITKRERNTLTFTTIPNTYSVDTVGYGGCWSNGQTCYPAFYDPEDLEFCNPADGWVYSRWQQSI